MVTWSISTIHQCHHNICKSYSFYVERLKIWINHYNFGTHYIHHVKVNKRTISLVRLYHFSFFEKYGQFLSWTAIYSRGKHSIYDIKWHVIWIWNMFQFWSFVSLVLWYTVSRLKFWVKVVHPLFCDRKLVENRNVLLAFHRKDEWDPRHRHCYT